LSADQHVKLHKGEFVCQRVELQGIVAHLHDLARHLENLIPDDSVLEKITRSRDFAGGFAARAAETSASKQKPTKNRGATADNSAPLDVVAARESKKKGGAG